jgi:hypothetical protein
VAEVESALDALAIPSSVKLAGAFLIGAGVTLGVTGLQALLFFVMRGPYQLVGPVALVLGGGCVFFGWGVVRARARAALGGIGLGAASSLFGAAWVILALMNGVLSAIALAVVPLAGLATLLIVVGLKDIKRIDLARERLRAQGLDTGL